MLDSVHQIGGGQKAQPVFGKYPLRALLQSQADGFAWAKGVHLYSELRLVAGLEIAASDSEAQKYLRIIEEYAHAGVIAAKLFGLDLLELQGNILHFHKDGQNLEDAADAALQFSYVFTKVLYEVLADDLGDQWHGFAICMDYGDSLIVRRGKMANSSAISLGPSANRPAKRLLYGKTAAGHAEIPGSWASRIFGRQCNDGWFAINLRDRDTLPKQTAVENADLEDGLRQALNQYRTRRATSEARSQPFTLLNATDLIGQKNFSTDNPMRMQACCMRVDLDGFTKLVADAFGLGDAAVETVAKGFVKILEFGDYFASRHYGVVRLPWAGDCVSFLIPPTGDLKDFRGNGWVGFVEEWQTFAGNTDEGRRQRWNNIFASVGWSVGMTYAKDGLCLVSTIATESRKFLISAGAPLAVANEAQNLGKGNETVIHSWDYDAAYPALRTLFTKLEGTTFWKGQRISADKVRRAAIEAGRSENASKIQIVEKAATISMPQPRPYCR